MSMTCSFCLPDNSKSHNGLLNTVKKLTIHPSNKRQKRASTLLASSHWCRVWDADPQGKCLSIMVWSKDRAEWINKTFPNSFIKTCELRARRTGYPWYCNTTHIWRAQDVLANITLTLRSLIGYLHVYRLETSDKIACREVASPLSISLQKIKQELPRPVVPQNGGRPTAVAGVVLTPAPDQALQHQATTGMKQTQNVYLNNSPQKAHRDPGTGPLALSNCRTSA